MNIKPEELEEFVHTSKSGDSFVYHFGDLAFDRLNFRRGVSLAYFDDRIRTNAEIAWSFYKAGFVSLVQRRIGKRGSDSFQYVMQRR